MNNTLILLQLFLSKCHTPAAGKQHRPPLLVTPEQKALFTKKAKASKLTVNEFVRRAAEVYDPSDDDEALMRLVAQVKQTTHEATAALVAALESCDESNRAEMEAAAHEHVG